ncbi:VOC family protein [Knoellia sp. S7-12]|uniref:VOC family protein n=1 Tax=Knoellia sp. S7-12 TaxID=3126698 RepID=UPI0033669AA8
MATHEEKWPAGTPCWVDITVSDLARSQAFYNTVLGWEFEESTEEYGGYTNAHLGGRKVAGMSASMEGMDWPNVWSTYFATDDVDATAAAATGAGAQQTFEPMDVGAFGRMAMWVDPGGAAFGAWESRDHTGYEAHNEHGAVGWVDLATRDLKTSKAFYGSVFGLTYEDMSMSGVRYATFTPPGGEWAAGGMGDRQVGDALGPRWCVTFEVDDVDVARQRAVEAGGAAPEAPLEFEFGRIATVKGPDGEEFSLMTSKAPDSEAPTAP